MDNNDNIGKKWLYLKDIFIKSNKNFSGCLLYHEIDLTVMVSDLETFYYGFQSEKHNQQPSYFYPNFYSKWHFQPIDCNIKSYYLAPINNIIISKNCSIQTLKKIISR